MEGTEIHDHQVTIEPQVDEYASEGQCPALVEPLKKGEGTSFPAGKISQHESKIPDTHYPIGKDHAEHEAQHCSPVEKGQYEAGQESGHHRRGKAKGDGAVIFKR